MTQLVAHLNDCVWCIDAGQFASGQPGVIGEKLLAASTYAFDPRFSVTESAALGNAGAATEVGVWVSDDVFS